MKNSLKARGMTLLAIGLLIAGCSQDAPKEQANVPEEKPVVANRGEFSSGSCNENERVAVDSTAIYAIYVDESGNPVGPGPLGFAEDLTGTSNKMMCPTPGEDPSACPTGYCQRLVSGKTYCLRC